MEDIRKYVQEFEPQIPYDPETDTLLEVPEADKLARMGGAVVYSHRSVVKPLKPIYSAAAVFADTLQGKVLIVGDNKGAVAIRTGFKHVYVKHGGPWTLEESNMPGARNERLIDEIGPHGLKNHLLCNRYDHVVCLLRVDTKFDYGDAQIHYMTLVNGVSGVVAVSADNEYTVMGKIIQLHVNPVGASVCHTSLCKAFEPIHYAIVWRTAIFPKDYYSSIIPLSNHDRLGPVSSLYCADKSDGVPVYLRIEGRRASYFDAESNPVLEGIPVDAEDQVLVCEDLGDRLVVSEPLYHSQYSMFEEWLQSGDNITFGHALNGYEKYSAPEFKNWYSFPPSGEWQHLTEGEGIVLKKGHTVIGARLHQYRKLATYYVKVKERASYEDYVDKYIKGVTRTVTFYRGEHGLYKDPRNVYTGAGIYEVLVESMELSRKRNKQHADFKWYVDAVSSKLDWKKILVSHRVCAVFGIRNDGVSQIMTALKIPIKQQHIVKDGGDQLVVSVVANIGDVLVRMVYDKGKDMHMERCYTVTSILPNLEMGAESISLV